MALSPSDVVAQFHHMVSSDGSSLTLLDLSESRARIRYAKTGVAHCETCVLTHDDLREMLIEAFKRNGTGITTVEIL